MRPLPASGLVSSLCQMEPGTIGPRSVSPYCSSNRVHRTRVESDEGNLLIDHEPDSAKFSDLDRDAVAALHPSSAV